MENKITQQSNYELKFLISGTRLFVGKSAQESGFSLSKREMLVDTVEFMNIVDGRGQVNSLGILLGDMNIPEGSLTGILAKDSIYRRVYFQTTSNLKIN